MILDQSLWWMYALFGVYKYFIARGCNRETNEEGNITEAYLTKSGPRQ